MGSGGLQDLRYALKGLVSRPGFTALTVLTIGLGVGASTAVFTVVDAVVFRALPYEEPDQLVSMWTMFESMGPGSFGLSDAEYIDYAQEQTSFESFGAYALTSFIERLRSTSPSTYRKTFTADRMRRLVGLAPVLRTRRHTLACYCSSN